ncbi:glycosyltransferase family 2 protein [Flavobacterium sp.]|uniref:glycosyltransferase family 2 protein n=1 Tax=Flavobacterium sp. TaxID=239 RepID=UPI002ED96B48
MITDKNPIVSVVIPCYNDKNYIQETIKSVLDQSFQDFEIIIVDDGSDVETKKVLSTIIHEKIKLVTQKNKGLSAARNLGIEKAKGLYILTIDSDDTFDKSFLQKAVKILNDDQKISVVSSYCNIFINENQIISFHEPIGGGVKNFLFENNCVSFALYRRKCWQIIGGYDEQMKNGFEDWEFWINLTKKCNDVYIIPEYLFNYRQKKTSMSKDSKMYHRETNLNYIFNKHIELYRENFSETINVLTSLAQRNKRNEIKYKNSLEFKIGTFFLAPLRWVKNIVKK